MFLNTISLRTKKRFVLPPAGTFQPNGVDDPLPYYYKLMVGNLYRKRIEVALSLLNPRYGAILELGYGSGILLPSLCKIADSVTGIDLISEPEQVNMRLRKIGLHCPLIQGDIADDFFKEESFDLIVAISIFEHICDLRPIFERLHNLLRPSGQLLVGMPRVDRFMENAFSLIGFNTINEHHFTTYKKCRRQAGEKFKLLQTAHFPAILPEPMGLYFAQLFEKMDKR